MQERDREIERLGQQPLIDEIGWESNQSKWEELIDMNEGGSVVIDNKFHWARLRN